MAASGVRIVVMVMMVVALMVQARVVPTSRDKNRIGGMKIEELKAAVKNFGGEGVRTNGEEGEGDGGEGVFPGEIEVRRRQEGDQGEGVFPGEIVVRRKREVDDGEGVFPGEIVVRRKRGDDGEGVFPGEIVIRTLKKHNTE